jgi:hypothetical protein
MAVRNCAFGIVACIIMAMGASRTHGQSPVRNLHPQQVALLSDRAGSICTTIAEIRDYEGLGNAIRAQVTGLLQKIARTGEHPDWLRFNLEHAQLEGLLKKVRTLSYTGGCHTRLTQLLVDTIYCSNGRANWCNRGNRRVITD